MFGSLRNPLQSLQLNRTLKTRIIIFVFAQIVFCKLLLSLVFVTRLWRKFWAIVRSMVSIHISSSLAGVHSHDYQNHTLQTRPAHLLYRAYHRAAVKPAHAIAVLGNIMPTQWHLPLVSVTVPICNTQTLVKLFNFETAVILRPSNN